MRLLPSPRFRLTLRVIPIVLGILIFKYIAHYYGWEFLSLSPLFGAIISANVFLVGFLISGVLADYKESEKLPGELACSLETLLDECVSLNKTKPSPEARACFQSISGLLHSILGWFHKKEKTGELMTRLSALYMQFASLEPLTQANFIVRLKQEQSAIRRMVTRIHTIRETSFNPTAYAIVEIITFILSLGLVFTRIDPYYESMFFVAFVSFILIYMVMLIKDLDNPFAYYEADNVSEEVSLKPLLDLEQRAAEMMR
ncbi:MAG: hypothetical protein WCG83_07070 [Candidatus Peregrinibacteria bacterium]